MNAPRMTLGTSLLGAGALLLAAACGGTAVSVGGDDPTKSDAGSSGSSGGEGTGDAAVPGKTCTTDNDCGAPGTGNYCGFASSLACAATGSCFAIGLVATCAAYSPGCACDGTEINVACSPLPGGYVSKPLLHSGSCSSVSDAGGGAPCVDNTGCPDGFACGYPEKDQCAAQGQCISTKGVPLCNSISPGCACDGTTLNIACGPLPNGYSEKPLLHTGFCADAGK